MMSPQEYSQYMKNQPSLESIVGDLNDYFSFLERQEAISRSHIGIGTEKETALRNVYLHMAANRKT